MSLLPLLGKHLKHDDDVLELLEFHEIDVIYSFDRTHENAADVYWAAAKQAGFQCRFNEQQILDTLFLYIQPSEGFAAIEHDAVGVPIYTTFDAALAACRAEKIPYKTSPNDKWWIKLDFGEHTRHYQYRNDKLLRITLSAVALGAS